MVLHGAHFTATPSLSCQVGVGGAIVPAVWLSSTQISCEMPPLSLSTNGDELSVEIYVSTDGQQLSQHSLAYTYAFVPDVLSVYPTSGPLLGGTLVTVTGVGFKNTGAISCWFGPTQVVPAGFLDANHITCTTPANPAGAAAAAGPVAVMVALNGHDFIAEADAPQYATTSATSGTTASTASNRTFTFVSERISVTDMRPRFGPVS